VSESLGLANRLADYWYEGLSTSKMACTNYFERYLLRQVNRPVAECLTQVPQNLILRRLWLPVVRGRSKTSGRARAIALI
ncbi:MAG: hypothetical protein F6K50_50875, partial [Moorea sp. SIO3I7]|nr:hypothetical protein [Moorena sp. SIO3I7]